MQHGIFSNALVKTSDFLRNSENTSCIFMSENEDSAFSKVFKSTDLIANRWKRSEKSQISNDTGIDSDRILL